MDQLIFVPHWDRLGFELLTSHYKVNNKAITDIHSPVLIGVTKDLNKVPRLWFPVILGLEKKRTKTFHNKTTTIVFSDHCQSLYVLSFGLTYLKPSSTCRKKILILVPSIRVRGYKSTLFRTPSPKMCK